MPEKRANAASRGRRDRDRFRLVSGSGRPRDRATMRRAVVVSPHRQSSVNASPLRRTRRPDSHRRGDEIGIVECPSSNVDQVRSCLCLAEERRAAFRAETAVHSISAVRHTREITRPPTDPERRGAKTDPNRSTASAQVLAIAAPAYPRSDWRFSALPANRTAKTPASNCHCSLQAEDSGMLLRNRTLGCVKASQSAANRRMLALWH